MGLAHGKLTIPHVEDRIKAETASETARVESTKETASQLVNGDANAMCNVPSIDEVLEEPDTLKDTSAIHSNVADTTAECVPNGDQSVANGTIGSTESATANDHCRKRSKNPLTWIKRRLSKKSNESRRPSGDRQAVPGDVDAPAREEPAESLVPHDTEASPDQTIAKQIEITEAAISLVDEVLSSAITAQTDENAEHSPIIEEAKVESQVLPEHPVEEEPSTQISSEPTAQHENEPASPELTSETQMTPHNGDHKAEEDSNKTMESDHSYTDSKSPRSTEPELEADHSTGEAVATKLAGMELTNGHSYECSNGGNLDSEAAMHSEVIH